MNYYFLLSTPPWINDGLLGTFRSFKNIIIMAFVFERGETIRKTDIKLINDGFTVIRDLQMRLMTAFVPYPASFCCTSPPLLLKLGLFLAVVRSSECEYLSTPCRRS